MTHSCREIVQRATNVARRPQKGLSEGGTMFRMLAGAAVVLTALGACGVATCAAAQPASTIGMQRH